jgi:hypothetical protein
VAPLTEEAGGPRVMTRAPRHRRAPAVITACLALGILLSSAGTGLAVSGLSGDGTAVLRQYETPGGTATTPPLGGTPPATTTTTTGAPGTTGGTDTGAVEGTTSTEAPTTPTATEEQSGVAGVQTTEKPTSDTAGEQARDLAPLGQVQAATASGDELPFTGASAIPILAAGLVLLLVGLVLRRRAATGRG